VEKYQIKYRNNESRDQKRYAPRQLDLLDLLHTYLASLRWAIFLPTNNLSFTTKNENEKKLKI